MVKVDIEYVINCSPKILYQLISTPSGLSEWFADDVNIKNDIFTFIWDGSEEQAKLLGKKKGESIKFHWLDHDDDNTYLEMTIKIDELTKDVALLITDFCDEGEEDETRELWTSQLDELSHRIGG